MHSSRGDHNQLLTTLFGSYDFVIFRLTISIDSNTANRTCSVTILHLTLRFLCFDDLDDGSNVTTEQSPAHGNAQTTGNTICINFDTRQSAVYTELHWCTAPYTIVALMPAPETVVIRDQHSALTITLNHKNARP